MTEIFILKFLSPETGCSAHELRFEGDRSVIAAILAISIEDIKAHAHYPDCGERAAIAEAFGFLLPEWQHDVQLTRPHRIDTAPYLIHTNFELPLMLDGRKPFAAISGEADVHPLQTLRACFRPHLELGSIIERVIEVQAGSKTILSIYYALPGEEWRFDAYDALINDPRPWTAEMERRQGTLLGYTDEQNDWWIANRNKPAA